MAERTTRDIGNGSIVLGQWKGAMYVRVNDPVPIEGGCSCTYCKAHPDRVPMWDTLVVPITKGGTDYAHTVHMPDTREFYDNVRKEAKGATK